MGYVKALQWQLFAFLCNFVLLKLMNYFFVLTQRASEFIPVHLNIFSINFIMIRQDIFLFYVGLRSYIDFLMHFKFFQPSFCKCLTIFFLLSPLIAIAINLHPHSKGLFWEPDLSNSSIVLDIVSDVDIFYLQKDFDSIGALIFFSNLEFQSL